MLGENNVNDTELIIPSVNLRIINKDGKPALEMRKIVTDLELIKHIITSAYHDRTMVMHPNFTNKALAINRLIEVGLIHKEGNEYFFLF